MNIRLIKMTRMLNRIYFRKFKYDVNLLEETDTFRQFKYNKQWCDVYWKRQRKLGRIHLAIMRGMIPIGEVILKNLDHSNKCCILSIHLRNDSVKDKGYGTAAEIQALQYAFNKLQCDTVYADAIKRNLRSRHVLEKVGFQEMYYDERFVYYRCEKNNRNPDGHI